MLWSAFILGLAGSIHCIGMCGPIALMIPTGRGQSKGVSLALYHLGKLLTYLIIGVAFGLIVAGVHTFNVQSTLTIISGVLLLLFAIIPQVLSRLEKKGYTLFNGILAFKQKLAQALNKNKIEFSFYIGFLNGFIPCAMVYSAAIVALSQKTMMNSMVYMLFFGLGTIPLMVIFFYSAHALKAKVGQYANLFRRLAFIIVGLFLVWRGASHYNEAIPQPKAGGNFELCLPF